MTGDGAVVREQMLDALTYGTQLDDDGEMVAVSRQACDEAVAAIRQQAAEIERLIINGELLLARVSLAEARNADLLKALERYGAHTEDCRLFGNMDLTNTNCTCGLAAAKGGTV